MKYLFRVIRWPLGQLVIFTDWITRPPIPEIEPDRWEELDAMTATMKMYQFKQCPFCVKTRRSIRRLGLNIELREARNDPSWNRELINEVGKVPGALPAPAQRRRSQRMDVRLGKDYLLPRSTLRLKSAAKAAQPFNQRYGILIESLGYPLD